MIQQYGPSFCHTSCSLWQSLSLNFFLPLNKHLSFQGFFAFQNKHKNLYVCFHTCFAILTSFPLIVCTLTTLNCVIFFWIQRQILYQGRIFLLGGKIPLCLKSGKAFSYDCSSTLHLAPHPFIPSSSHPLHSPIHSLCGKRQLLFL